MQHALQLDDVGAFDVREAAIAETTAGGVVDPLHLGHRRGVLADFDRQADVIAAAAGIVRVRDLDRGRLQVAPPLVAALGVARFERENHSLRERHAAAFARLERRRDGVDNLRADHDVRLHGVVAALPASGPRTVLLAGVRGGAPLHVDHPELPRLAHAIVGEELLDRRLRLDAFRHQVESAHAIFDHRRCLRADGADAGAHPRHRSSDKRHARRHRRARLPRRRIDRAQRERRVLRQPLGVQCDAIGRALLGRNRQKRQGRRNKPSKAIYRRAILPPDGNDE